jgi:hypothetical protein
MPYRDDRFEFVPTAAATPAEPAKSLLASAALDCYDVVTGIAVDRGRVHAFN